MSLPAFNTKSPTIKRILKEAAELSTNPDPTLHAAPLESNLFEWHFTLRGPPSTPYSAGSYHGRIILPQQYPLRPPSFRFMTPSGRFEVNREICLSISGHHEETWQPAWGIRTALWALRAFMEGSSKGQVGGMDMGEAERTRLAEESRAWRCTVCGGKTNSEILEAQADGVDGAMFNSKAQIPDELRFGFKDEMQVEKKVENLQRGQATDVTADKTREKQIEYQTTPSSPILGTSGAAAATNPPSMAPVLSTSGTGVAEQARQQTAQPQPSAVSQPSAQSSPQEAIPGWIDKVIVGLVGTLLVMILKKLIT